MAIGAVAFVIRVLRGTLDGDRLVVSIARRAALVGVSGASAEAAALVDRGVFFDGRRHPGRR